MRDESASRFQSTAFCLKVLLFVGWWLVIVGWWLVVGCWLLVVVVVLPLVAVQLERSKFGCLLYSLPSCLFLFCWPH